MALLLHCCTSSYYTSYNTVYNDSATIAITTVYYTLLATIYKTQMTVVCVFWFSDVGIQAQAWQRMKPVLWFSNGQQNYC
jgi:hypothetical protein